MAALLPIHQKYWKILISLIGRICYSIKLRIICFLTIAYLPLISKAQEKVNDTDRFLLTVTPIFGFNQSKINYSIAGNSQGSSPNVLSELIWSKLKAWQYGIETSGIIRNRIPWKISYFRSDIFSGNVTDIDYAEDNRKAPFSEQDLSSHKGFENLFKAQTGYRILNKQAISLSAIFGFEHLYRRAYLLNHRGDNKVNNPTGYYEGLYSYYGMNWKSVGLVTWAEYLIAKPLSIQVELGGYRSFYFAHGNWNLIPNFVHPRSYTHKDTGFHWMSNVMLSYRINKKLNLKIRYSFSQATLQQGEDKLYLKDGRVNQAMLNEVKYTSRDASVGLAYSFITIN